MTRRQTFDVGADARIDVETRSGSVDVRAGAAGRVSIEIDSNAADDWDLSQFGEAVTVRPGGGWRSRSARIMIEAPAGTDVDIRGASTAITLTGAFGSVRTRTASGDIRCDTATELEANTAAGDVRVNTVMGNALASTVSGDVELGSVTGRFLATSASGDIDVRHLGGDAHISTTSGDVRIGRFDGSEVAVKCVSGDIEISLPAGIRVEPDLSTLSGRTRLPKPAGQTPNDAGERRVVRVGLRTVSGDITIERI
jgi:DUF4097 and DUF4098 domain-containing protein YvlB